MGKLKPLRLPRSPSLRIPKVNFGLTCKKWFFDRENVKRYLDEETRRVFNRFGATVMRYARKSIRKRIGAARPGQPPHSHVGHLKSGPHSIRYSFDKVSRGVVVGPLQKESRNDYVPNALEYGRNNTTRGVNPRRRIRRVGDGGAIRFSRQRPKATQKANPQKGLHANPRRMKDRNGNLVWVTFVKLKSQDMVWRSMRTERELFGNYHVGGKGKPLLPRPYMRPAFNAIVPHLPRFWEEARRETSLK